MEDQSFHAFVESDKNASQRLNGKLFFTKSDQPKLADKDITSA
jgi:hypothetical protein